MFPFKRNISRTMWLNIDLHIFLSRTPVNILSVKCFFIYIGCILLICPSLQAQDKNADLSIRIHSIGNGKEFTTDIFRSGKKVKIVFARKDSIGRGLGKDERFLQLFHVINSKDSPLTGNDRSIAFKSLMALTKEYTYYSKDSILISLRKHKAFEELLSRVADPSNDEPEKELESAKNRKVLDGTSYMINISSVTKVKAYQLSSPSPVSHPFIYRIIHEPLNFKKF